MYHEPIVLWLVGDVTDIFVIVLAIIHGYHLVDFRNLTMKFIRRKLKDTGKPLKVKFLFLCFPKPSSIFKNSIFPVLRNELRRLEAAKRSPIPIEPLHSFSYGHLHHQQMGSRRLRTYNDDDDLTQDGAHTFQTMHCLHLCNLTFEIHFMVN